MNTSIKPSMLFGSEQILLKYLMHTVHFFAWLLGFKNANYILGGAGGLNNFWLRLYFFIIALNTRQFLDIIFKVEHECVKAFACWACGASNKSFTVFVTHSAVLVFYSYLIILACFANSAKRFEKKR